MLNCWCYVKGIAKYKAITAEDILFQFLSVGIGEGMERVVFLSNRMRITVARENTAEGGSEVAQLLRDGLPGGDGDLSVDEAGLIPGDGREKEGEVLGHYAIGQTRRQRGHDPGMK